MQTFLPFSDFRKSAECLDRKRLGKQRVETLQIMNALFLNKGWINHPAVHMWRGYESILLMYQVAICNAWCRYGYKDTCLPKTIQIYGDHNGTFIVGENPPWLGSDAFHRSHQSNLIRKNPEWYGPLFPGVPDDLPYIWPTKENNGPGKT